MAAHCRYSTEQSFGRTRTHDAAGRINPVRPSPDAARASGEHKTGGRRTGKRRGVERGHDAGGAENHGQILPFRPGSDATARRFLVVFFSLFHVNTAGFEALMDAIYWRGDIIKCMNVSGSVVNSALQRSKDLQQTQFYGLLSA